MTTGPRHAGELLTGSDVASSDDLARFSIHDVLSGLDQHAPSARDLYYRWERQQWAATEIDLASDRAEWDALEPGARTSVAALFAALTQGAEERRAAVVALADFSPLEEQQVFFTTHLVDLARQAVFAGRFARDVLRESDDLAASESPLSSMLGERAARAAGGDRSSLAEVALMQPVILEGSVAVTIGRRLVDWLGAAGLLAGLRAGLMAMARDHVRHTLFGVLFLQTEIAAGTDVAGRLQSLAAGIVPSVPRLFDGVAAGSMDLSGLPFGANDLTGDAMDALAARMQDVGLDAPG